MNERQKLLQRIQACCFVLTETGLYLDAHPACRAALRHFERYSRMRDEAVHRYEQTYGALTYTSIDAANGWNWVTEPFPWEA